MAIASTSAPKVPESINLISSPWKLAFKPNSFPASKIFLVQSLSKTPFSQKTSTNSGLISSLSFNFFIDGN